MKDFVSVWDDMPLDDPNFVNLTVDVKCLLKDGSIVRGFYDNRDAIWHIQAERGYKKTLDVIAWSSL